MILDEETRGMDFSDLRVLLIESDHHYRGIMRMILYDIGIRNLAEKDDVTSALKELRRNKFDAIITELKYPSIDGLQLLELVRHDEQIPDNKIPFFLIVDTVSRAQVISAKENGADGVWMKPVTAALVKQRLPKVLEGRRSIFREWQKTKTLGKAESDLFEV